MTHLRRAKADTDYVRISALLSLISDEPITAEGLIDDDQFMLPGKIRERWVAVDAGDQVLGFGMLVKYPSQPPEIFHMELVVDPSTRQHGIGTQLLRQIEHIALGFGCGRMITEVPDDDPAAHAFSTKNGFQIHSHIFGSQLDVTAFDTHKFDGIIEQVQAQGIRFTTLAEEGDTEEARRKLYALNRMAVLDEAGDEALFKAYPTYDNWCRIVLGSRSYRPASQFIAAIGEEYIGLAGIYNEPETPHTLFNGYTGVIAEYRGQHIALALKLLTVRYAQQHGGHTIQTETATRNAPMVAINKKLGYIKTKGRYMIYKDYQD